MVVWPDEYRTWAAGRGLLDGDTLTVAARAPVHPAVRRDAVGASTRRFEITSPADGATYMVDPTLRKEFQAVSLRAVGASGLVEWAVNGRRVGTVSTDENLTWPLERGQHLVRAKDANGHVADASILVK